MLISSRSNPKIKQVRALRQRKERQATGLFLVEGIRPVGEAAQAGAAIDSIYYAPDLLESDYARRLIEEESSR
ncbi:MAG TPA: RNA methyltransferase, partial [Anaerolineales bacterium]